MVQTSLKFLCVILLADATHATRAANLKEIEYESLKHHHHRNLQASSSGCISDTQRIDENISLQDKFHNVLQTFSNSFDENTAWDYCDPTIKGEAVTLDCVVDYSSFLETDTYNSECESESLGGKQYNISILMLCSSDSNSLNMDLKNIPTCLGKSCDSRHLYSTLINVLDGVKGSIGSGAAYHWTCRYYHDFESLIAAPSTVIEIPEEEVSPSKWGSQASSHHNIISYPILCVVASMIYMFL